MSSVLELKLMIDRPYSSLLEMDDINLTVCYIQNNDFFAVNLSKDIDDMLVLALVQDFTRTLKWTMLPLETRLIWSDHHESIIIDIREENYLRRRFLQRLITAVCLKSINHEICLKTLNWAYT